MKRCNKIVHSSILLIIFLTSSIFAIQRTNNNNNDNNTTPFIKYSQLKGINRISSDDLITTKSSTLTNSSNKQIKVTSEDKVASLINSLFHDNNSQVRISRIQKDDIGLTHIRLTQYYLGYPVIGTDIVVHIDENMSIIGIDGSIAEALSANVHPSLSKTEAEGIAKASKKVSITKNNLVIFDNKLCYEMLIYDKTEDAPALWRTYIDAITGQILSKKNDIRYAAPSNNGTHLQISGARLNSEGGQDVTFEGWRDNGGNYFLYNKNAHWGVYNTQLSDWEQRSTGNWGISDPVAISAAKNLAIVQNYTSTVLNRNSIDGLGGFVGAHIHERNVEAYYGDVLHFGDGDGVNFGPYTTLDIVAHEFAHGITEYTSGLIYEDESGALNESFSDIFGTLVEFYAQPDGRSAYPSKINGAADWLIAEDCALGPNPLRDMRNPERLNKPSFYFGPYWHNTYGDDGGVHTNSSVQNYLFYLLSEGGTINRYGRTYTIAPMGIQNAGRLAMYVNMYMLTNSAQYIDCKNGWVQAAGLLGLDATNVRRAWEAVGVFDKPWFTISPTNSFNSATVNQSTPVSLTAFFQNRGELTVNYSISSPLPSWLTASKNSGSITAKNFDFIDFTLNPAGLATGFYKTVIRFNHNTPLPFNMNFPDSINLLFLVYQPVTNASEIAVTPQPLNFGSIPLSTPTQKQFTITNSTTNSLTINSIILGGSNLFGSGRNNSGQIGTGDFTDKQSITAINLQEVIQIASSDNHTAALCRDGSVWTWGDNSFGQLADGTLANRSTPRRVVASGVKKIVVANGNTYFLHNDNTVRVAGWNGSTSPYSTPTDLYTGAVDIAACYQSVCFLRAEGSVFAWGRDKDGNLGNYTYGLFSPFRFLDAGVKKVYACDSTYYFLTSTGDLFAIGSNREYQIGDNTTISKSFFVKVPIDNVAELFTGKVLYTRKTDGTIWAWGNGLLGDGSTTTAHPVPVQISFTNVARIEGQTMLKSDGSLWGWGSNNFGELPSAGCTGCQNAVTAPVLVDLGPVTHFSKSNSTLILTKSNIEQSNTIGRTLPFTIAANSSATVNISFNIGTSGAFTDVLSLNTSSKLQPWTSYAAQVSVGGALHTITASAGTGGTITPSGDVTVEHGLNQTFNISPSQGYAIDALIVDGNSIGALPNYTFNNVTENHTINALFKTSTITKVTATVAAVSSTESGHPGSYAVDGNTTTRWSTAYSDPQWIVFDMGSQRSITDVVFDWELANARNYILEGSNDLNFSTKTTLVIKTGMANVNHRIDSLYGLTGPYRYYRMYGTVRNNAWGYSIYEARFYTRSTVTNYALTVNSTNGTVILNPTGGTYPSGTVVTLTAQPSAGWTFANWSGDVTGSSTSASVTMNSNKTVTANYNRITFTITASAGPNGTISPSNVTTVNYNGDQLYTFTPNSGYTVDAVTVDGVNRGALTSYQFTGVTSNHSIQVSFKQQTQQSTITVTSGAGGTITPSGVLTRNNGDIVQFTITANSGYRIKDVLVDNVSIGAVSTYSLTVSRSAHSVNVTFEQVSSDLLTKYSVPASSPFSSLDVTYRKFTTEGTGAPNLSNVTSFQINWNQPYNGLYVFAMNTNNGVPSWWIDLTTKATVDFNRNGPRFTLRNSGITNLDGGYYITMYNGNMVWVEQSGKFAITFQK
jgi:Zn-dependent metalloprotease/alpha-tubulin suppressor-like RCC1 family protein